MKLQDKNDRNDNGVPDYFEKAIFWYMFLDMIKAVLIIVGIYIAIRALGFH